MKLATSTCDFSEYVNNVYENLDCFDNTGFKYLDFNFDCETVYEILEKDDYLEEFKKIRDYADQKGYVFVQSHAPCCGNGLKKDEKYAKENWHFGRGYMGYGSGPYAQQQRPRGHCVVCYRTGD